MLAKDVISVHLSAELFALSIVARETLRRVGDVNATVGGALHGSKDAGSGGGTGEAHVEEAAEGARLVLLLVLEELVSGDLLGSLVDAIELELLQETTGKEKASAVGGGVVGQTDLDAVAGQLVGVCGANDLVTLDLGVGHLADDVLVREANDHAVLGGVVLVAVLDHQPATGIVVSAPL